MYIIRKPWRGAVAVSLALTLSACSTVKGWFEIDDDEDPTQPVELVDITETVNIKKLWSSRVGDGQGDGYYKIQPVISGDIIYAASAEGELVAINRHSGKTQWKIELETELSGGVGVYEDSLFVGSSDGSVVKLSARDGSMSWSTRLTGEVLAPPQANGKVVVAQTYDGKMQGLNFDTGEKIWVFDSNVPVLTAHGRRSR